MILTEALPSVCVSLSPPPLPPREPRRPADEQLVRPLSRGTMSPSSILYSVTSRQ
jgi:hypothetical protein